VLYTFNFRDGPWLTTLADTSNSGIYVVEGPARGQPIPVDGDSVTAFVSPAPRGPVDHAVSISSLEEFQKIFSVPDYHCRLEFAVRQFFANGGVNAVIVRVSGTKQRNRICLPGAEGDLVLEAKNPGPLEYLRASIDYDDIAGNSQENFNLIVQRLRSSGSAWIDVQECYRNVSTDPGSRDYLGYVLSQSELVQLAGNAPKLRPRPTIKPTTVRQAGYVEALAECVNSPPPSDYDLIGSVSQGTGLNALEHIPDIGQVCLVSGAEGAPLGPVALLAADRFCRDHQALLIIDPPSRWESVEDVLRDQERSGFCSPNAVTWYPGVCALNGQGERVYTSIVGSVAAALKSADQIAGVYQLHNDGPVMLRGNIRLTEKIEKQDVRRLARAGINSLIQRSPLHLQLMGNVTQARYGSIAGEWTELDLRRQVLFILRRIRQGTLWTFFSQSNPETWQEVENQVSVFLTELHARSVIAGEYASLSYFVKCDSDTNSGLLGRDGEVTFVAGFALRRPGEFLAFRFQQAQGMCHISELGWQAGFACAI
jgi:hypothetical protein